MTEHGMKRKTGLKRKLGLAALALAGAHFAPVPIAHSHNVEAAPEDCFETYLKNPVAAYEANPFALNQCFQKAALDENGLFAGHPVIILFTNELAAYSIKNEVATMPAIQALLEKLYTQEQIAALMGVEGEASLSQASSEDFYGRLEREYPHMLIWIVSTHLNNLTASVAESVNLSRSVSYRFAPDAEQAPRACVVTVSPHNMLYDFATSDYHRNVAMPKLKSDYVMSRADIDAIKVILWHEIAHCFGFNEWGADAFSVLRMAAMNKATGNQFGRAGFIADSVMQGRLQFALGGRGLSGNANLVPQESYFLHSQDNQSFSNMWPTSSYGWGMHLVMDNLLHEIRTNPPQTVEQEIALVDRLSAEFIQNFAAYETAFFRLSGHYLHHAGESSTSLLEAYRNYRNEGTQENFKIYGDLLQNQNNVLLKLIDDEIVTDDLQKLIIARIVVENAKFAEIAVPQRAVDLYDAHKNHPLMWRGFPNPHGKIARPAILQPVVLKHG